MWFDFEQIFGSISHDIANVKSAYSNTQIPRATIGCVVAMAVACQDNSAVSGAGQEAVVREATLVKILTGIIVSHVGSVHTTNLA